MILQALCEYYDRCASDPNKALPVMGFGKKEIPFTIVIDSDGNFINLEDNRYDLDKKLKVREFIVPQEQKRTGNIIANVLWDHYGYVLGIRQQFDGGDKEVKKAQLHAELQFKSFVQQTKLIADDTQDPDVIAVLRFLQNKESLKKIKEHKLYKDLLKKPGTNLAFRLNVKQELVCQTFKVQEWIKNNLEKSKEDFIDGVSLISGKKGKIVRLHDKIRGITDIPASLASINKDSFESYGKKQGFNFPCSSLEVFKFTSALNELLKSSLNKLCLSNMTMVFWSQKRSDLEDTLLPIFEDNNDNLNEGIQTIRNIYASIHKGCSVRTDGGSLFYVLGLAPNSSRIMIRFWITGTVASFTQQIIQWFDDINIFSSRYNTERIFPLIAIVKRLSRLNKDDDPKLMELYENLVRAIFSNGKLPIYLLQTALLRIKADKYHVTSERVALIKAWLNRFYRITNKNKERVKVKLNTDEKDIGYNLGRLFAVLEKLQKDSSGGDLNSTIIDRYYSSASCRPMTVFSTLISLHFHHLKKLENIGKQKFYEKQIAAIMQNISVFPTNLNLEQQGFFAIGYYHQTQDLYTPKSEKEQNQI